MPAYMDPREREAIMSILDELRNYYDSNLDEEHLIDMVASEAKRHGIRASISAPFARHLIETGKKITPGL